MPYPVLHRLERNGFVKAVWGRSESGRRRKYYRLTDRGEEELASQRRQASALVEAGLTEDEAFLIAVKRIGELDALSREFAREHSERLWKRLVVAPDAASGSGGDVREALLAVGLAVAAALAIAVGAVAVNLTPFAPGGHTEILAALHLPIALWLAVGYAYAAGRWRDHDQRMNYVRFSGEWFIYYALIAFGGGVLMALTAFVFSSIGLEPEWLVTTWILPCGAVGAVVVAAWLVEAKQSVIENMAPVLTLLFTPLFTLLLLAFLLTMAWTGSGIAVERDSGRQGAADPGAGSVCSSAHLSPNDRFYRAFASCATPLPRAIQRQVKEGEWA
jgi:hypothetical protein